MSHCLGECLHLGLVVVADDGAFQAVSVNFVLAKGTDLPVAALDGIADCADEFFQTGSECVFLAKKHLEEINGESAGFHFCASLADLLHDFRITGKHLLAFQTACYETGVIVFLGLSLALLLKFVQKLAEFDYPILEQFDFSLCLINDGVNEFQQVV